MFTVGTPAAGASTMPLDELPTAGVPTVNIGDRQLGRLRAASIIDCPADQALILAALKSIFNGRFHAADFTEPPYGRGGASDKIAQILGDIDLQRAFPKHFHDLTIP